jgi:hypothetical protein
MAIAPIYDKFMANNAILHTDAASYDDAPDWRISEYVRNIDVKADKDSEYSSEYPHWALHRSRPAVRCIRIRHFQRGQ